jgi:hypothetical protein
MPLPLLGLVHFAVRKRRSGRAHTTIRDGEAQVCEQRSLMIPAPAGIAEL